MWAVVVVALSVIVPVIGGYAWLAVTIFKGE